MNTISLLLISDTHGCTDYTPLSDDAYLGIDACICMGDIYETELRRIKEETDKHNLQCYAIPGNHEPKDAIDKEGFTNFHGKVIEIGGLHIAGWGGCKKYKEADDVLFMTNKESDQFADTLPKADILISHSNPYRDNQNNPHSGLSGITRYLQKTKPTPLHFYGHIHERIENPKGYCIYKAAKVKITKMFVFYYSVDIEWVL